MAVQVLVGQPLVSHLPVRATDVAATLHLPGGETQSAPATNDGTSVVSEPTTRAGFHKLVLGPPASRTEWFAVNVDPQESDLSSLRVEDLKADILPGIEFSYLTEWADASTGDEQPAVRVVATGSGFSRALLLAALCLLVVELLMAWRFVAGVVLLVLLLAGSITIWTWTTSPMAGGVCAAALIGLAVRFGYSRRRAIH